MGSWAVSASLFVGFSCRSDSLENRDEEEQGRALFQAQASLPIPDFTATEFQKALPATIHTHTHTDMQTPARVTIPVPFLASPVPMTSSLG